MKLVIPQHVKNIIQDMSPQELKQKMDFIKTSIDSIFLEKAMNMNYQVIYDEVCTLVRKKQGEVLYKAVRENIEGHTKGICDTVDTQPDETFLQKLLAVWEKYRKCISKVRDLLLYLDENYVEKSSSHEKKILTVYESGIAIFRQEVLIKLTKRLQRLMNRMIMRERDGEEVADKFMLKNLTQMMVEVDKEKVYTGVFESQFLKESHEYYNKEAQIYFESSTAVVYLNRVQTRLKEELERATRCLDPDTKPKIENVIKEEMIEKYKELVVKKEGSGVLIMLQNQRKEELKLVFEVLSIVPGALNPTIDMVREYCKEEGEKVVTDKARDDNPTQLVNDVIELRVYYDDLLLQSFSSMQKGTRVRDKDFSKAIKEAFDYIVNENQRFPEYLSLVLDQKLSKGSGQGEEDKLDTFFDKVIMVFRHVREKDVFEKYYKNHLARRLLSGKVASDDDEKLFLSKLKSEFGYQFTAKLEGMFKDVNLSSQLMGEWKQHIEKNSKPAIDLSVEVLTHVYWPVTSNARLELPDLSLKQACDMFANFYISKYNGRKITWQYNMGTADVKANGFSKPYEFTVSTYQMAILLLFNDADQISLKEIFEKTKIPDADLKRSVVSLLLAVDAKEKSSKLLVRVADKKDEDKGDDEEEGKKKKVVTLEKDTVIKPNEAFKSNKIKNKVKNASKKEDKDERKETEEKINEERKWVVDAVIVRIMKMRKRAEHRALVNEVVEQLHNRFPASGVFIKKRIENLIDREYLERDEKDRNTYNYLA